MIKDDGAGIYTWNNTYGNNHIEGNIVVHGIGAGTGTANPDQLYVSGIYVDDRSSDILINNNTVAHCPTAGIFIHNAKQLTLFKNTLFGNGNPIANKESGQLLIKLDAIAPLVGSKALDLNVTENRVAATQEGSHCIYLSAEKKEDLNSLGSFDQNLYSASDAGQVVAKFYPQHDLCDPLEELNLAEWQRITGYDRSSVFKAVPSQDAKPARENLIRNSSMTNNTDGWMIWPAQMSIVHDTNQGVDGPSLKVQFSAAQAEALLYHSGIELNRNKLYRLSFTARSTKESKIEFVPLMAAAPWEALGDYRCFSINTGYKTFTYLFKPNRSNKAARVNFKSNAPFWIDNVTLNEVPRSSERNGESLRLLYNATENPQLVSLNGNYADLDGNSVSDPVVLAGFGSIILLKRPL